MVKLNIGSVPLLINSRGRSEKINNHSKYVFMSNMATNATFAGVGRKTRTYPQLYYTFSRACCFFRGNTCITDVFVHPKYM